eukprot:3894605-Rhodomonas_salina.1
MPRPSSSLLLRPSSSPMLQPEFLSLAPALLHPECLSKLVFPAPPVPPRALPSQQSALSNINTNSEGCLLTVSCDRGWVVGGGRAGIGRQGGCRRGTARR